MVQRLQPVVLSYVRSPFGSARGSLGQTNPVHLGGPVFREAVERAGLTPDMFNLGIVGVATQTGSQGVNVAQRIINEAFGSNSFYAKSENVSCASSMEAIIEASKYVRTGDEEDRFILVGGVESNSDKQAYPGSDLLPPPPKQAIPLLKQTLQRILMGVKYGKDVVRLNSELVRDSLPFDHRFYQMHESGDYLARLYGYDQRQLNEYAALSFARATDAAARGILKDEILRIDVRNNRGHKLGYVDRDETLREDSTFLAQEGLNKRTTIRGGLHHAGNSSQVAVGASALVIADEEAAKEFGAPILTRIIGTSRAKTDSGLGQLLGPLFAIPKALVSAGLLKKEAINDIDAIIEALKKIDIVEINEAFAAEVLAMMGAFKIPVEKTNPNGGPIAIGHPFAATGGRIVGHSALELQRRAKKVRETNALTGSNEKVPRYALATLCVAQGLGAAVVQELYS